MEREDSTNAASAASVASVATAVSATTVSNPILVQIQFFMSAIKQSKAGSLERETYLGSLELLYNSIQSEVLYVRELIDLCIDIGNMEILEHFLNVQNGQRSFAPDHFKSLVTYVSSKIKEKNTLFCFKILHLFYRNKDHALIDFCVEEGNPQAMVFYAQSQGSRSSISAMFKARGDLFAAQEPEKALLFYKHALLLDSENDNARHLCIQNAMQRNDFREAFFHLQILLKSYTDSKSYERLLECEKYLLQLRSSYTQEKSYEGNSNIEQITKWVTSLENNRDYSRVKELRRIDILNDKISQLIARSAYPNASPDELLQLISLSNSPYDRTRLHNSITTWISSFFSVNKFKKSEWLHQFQQLDSASRGYQKPDFYSQVFNQVLEIVFSSVDEEQLNEFALLRQSLFNNSLKDNSEFSAEVSSYCDACGVTDYRFKALFENYSIVALRKVAHYFATMAEKANVDDEKERSKNPTFFTGQAGASAGKAAAVQKTPPWIQMKSSYSFETECALYVYLRMQFVFQAHPPVLNIYKKYLVESRTFIDRHIHLYPQAQRIHELLQAKYLGPEKNQYFLRDLKGLIETTCSALVSKMNALILETALERYESSKWIERTIDHVKQQNGAFWQKKLSINNQLHIEDGGLTGVFGRSAVVMTHLAGHSSSFFTQIRGLFVIRSNAKSDHIANQEVVYAGVMKRAETTAAFKQRIDHFIDRLKYVRDEWHYDLMLTVNGYPKAELLAIKKLFYVDKKEADAIALAAKLLKADYEGTEEAITFIKGLPKEILESCENVDGLIVKILLKDLKNPRLACAYVDSILATWEQTNLSPKALLFERFISELADNNDKELIKNGRFQYLQNEQKKLGKRFVAYNMQRYKSNPPLYRLNKILVGLVGIYQEDIPGQFDFPLEGREQVEQFVGTLIDEWRQKKVALPNRNNDPDELFRFYCITKNRIHLPIIHKKIKEDVTVYNDIQFYHNFFKGFSAHYDSVEWNEMLKRFVNYLNKYPGQNQEVQDLLNVLTNPAHFQGDKTLPEVNKTFLDKTLHFIKHQFKCYNVSIEGESIFDVVDLIKSEEGKKPSVNVLLQCVHSLAVLHSQGELLVGYGEVALRDAARNYIKSCVEKPDNEHQKLAQFLSVIDSNPKPGESANPDEIIVRRLKEKDVWLAIEYIKMILISPELPASYHSFTSQSVQAMGFSGRKELLMFINLKEFQEHLVLRKKETNAAADPKEITLVIELVCHIKSFSDNKSKMVLDAKIAEWLDYFAAKVVHQPTELDMFHPCRHALRTFYQQSGAYGFPSYFHLDTQLAKAINENNKVAIMQKRFVLLRDYIELVKDNHAAIAYHAELIASLAEDGKCQAVVAKEKDLLNGLLQKQNPSASTLVGQATTKSTDQKGPEINKAKEVAVHSVAAGGLSMFGVPAASKASVPAAAGSSLTP